jgi:hypothetical protein
MLSNTRHDENNQLPLADLFRQSAYSRMSNYEDVNDAERSSQHPAFRLIGQTRSETTAWRGPSACRRSKPRCSPGSFYKSKCSSRSAKDVGV